MGRRIKQQRNFPPARCRGRNYIPAPLEDSHLNCRQPFLSLVRVRAFLLTARVLEPHWCSVWRCLAVWGGARASGSLRNEKARFKSSIFRRNQYCSELPKELGRSPLCKPQSRMQRFHLFWWVSPCPLREEEQHGVGATQRFTRNFCLVMRKAPERRLLTPVRTRAPGSCREGGCE